MGQICLHLGATNQFNIGCYQYFWNISTQNYPTNKDVIKRYSTTLSGATTSAATTELLNGDSLLLFGNRIPVFRRGQYSQNNRLDSGILWTLNNLPTVADWASLAISSTSTPNIFVKGRILQPIESTAQAMTSNANSDKDGSLKQTLTYQVIQ